MKLTKKEIGRDKRIVQGTYITVQNRNTLNKEAKRVGTNPTHLASYLLENELKKIASNKSKPKENGNENNSGNAAQNDL